MHTLELVILSALAVLMVWRMGDMFTRGSRARNAYRRGIEALEAQDWAAAEEAFRRVVRLEPIAAVPRRLLARVLVRSGQFEDAEEQLRAATAFEPRNPDGYAELGYFLALQGEKRAEEAIAAFEQAVAHAPRLREQLAREDALGPLRNHPRFQRLVAPPE